MDPWLSAVLAVLATWRLSYLLAYEEGPGGAVARWRTQLEGHLVGRVLGCFYCISLWIAAPLAAFVSLDPVEILVAWLAISGGACLLERLASEPVVIQQLSQEEQGDADHGMLWSRSPERNPPSGGNGDSQRDARHSQRDS